MELEKKVSVVIPVYNNEKYIEKCLESVINQTYPFLEIIVVNDGSTDGSIDILGAYEKKDSRIVLISQENGGVSRARNKAISKATGEYLLFVDGDDYIGKDYILELVRCAQQYQADMVICGMTKVDCEGQVIEEIIPQEYIRCEKEEWTYRISAAAAHFYKKDLWTRYDVTFQEGERGEDMPIALFFAAICEKIVILQKADYYYVQHEQSAMHNFRGLKVNGLPYVALENAIVKLRKYGVTNDVEFHELFVLRILCTCINLARGAEKTELVKLSEYICHILDDYYPYYYKNKKARIFSDLDVPFIQKLSVQCLILAKRFNVLRYFLYLVC